MQFERIDLYKYFKVKRPKNAQGYLNNYVISPCEEMGLNRLRPAMLVIGGGGYLFVSDREKEPVAIHYLSKGFDAFVLEYSVKPIAYPYQLVEACMAIAYIRENAEKLGVDKEHVGAVGFSAGGHLCAMLGNLFDEQVVKETLKDKANLCRPDAVVLAYPVISGGEFAHDESMNNISGGNNELRQALSLENRVKENSAPAFIWATMNDGCVRSENSLLMAYAYKKAKIPFELHVFEDGSHGLSLAIAETVRINDEASKWVELCDAWLSKRGFKISYKGE